MLELNHNAPEGIVIVIAGNKYDLSKQRQISEEEAEKISEEYNVQHFYTSAKSGKGIDDLFKSLTTSFYS